MSDSTGCIHNPKGLNIPELMRFKEACGHVAEFPASTPVYPQELLGLECEILIPVSTGEYDSR